MHDLSNQKTVHTTGGSGRGCAHGGAAGRAGPGRTERRRNGSPRKEPSSDALANQRQPLWTTLRKHEQRNSYVNRLGNKARGLQAGRGALFVPGCWPVYRRLPVSVNPLCRACPGKARTAKTLCKPMGEQSPRLTTGSSAGREAPLVPRCPLVDRLFSVSAHPSHPKDVRGTIFTKTKRRRTIGQQPGTKSDPSSRG